MEPNSKIDWDDAYANVAHVPGADALPAKWAADAQSFRQSGIRMDQDIAYGHRARQKLDLVWPDKAPKGLAVYVHGGYWMRLSKSDWTAYAAGAHAAGWAVAVLGYTLAPDARISEITKEIGQAITHAAGLVKGPIHLAGHSAGGHLVSRMVCTSSPLPKPILARLGPVLSISGLHDLRPLLQTQMNKTLNLDVPEARRESPALLEPIEGSNVTAWVGGAERPEFIRQAKLLETVWAGFDISVRSNVEDGHNHFSVVEGLRDPSSPITSAWIGH